MKNVPIKNPDVLDALNNFLWYFDNRDTVEKHVKLECAGHKREDYVSTKFRDNIIKQDYAHEGYPDAMRGYNLKGDRISKLPEGDNGEFANLISKYNDLNTELCHSIGAKNNALTVMYPPDGFIAWHNNANACAYNLIFTWSETGDGCFRYVDGHTGDEVVMQDVKGWQCKAGYFGHYDEPWYKRVYHAAETDCWRMTVSYMFDRSDMSLGLQDDIIEEIMSDF
jgi:hypothetical protein